MELKKQIGQRIKAARKTASLTQKVVSEKMGMVIQQYQTYESGRYELNYQQLINLCRILDVSADYLLGLTDNY